jgi:hypothetical protein
VERKEATNKVKVKEGRKVKERRKVKVGEGR